ncbi:unnamed protein product [Pylaiella littoralis]
MKTSFCTASGVLAAAIAVGNMTPATAQDAIITNQARVTAFDADDFVFPLGTVEPTNLVNGFQIRGVNVNQLPALDGYGISMALVNLDPCTINLPHLHPRATEISYVISGGFRTAFVEENGGEGAVMNDLVAGDVTLYPQGLIHYQQNLGCEPAVFLAALSSEDPGAVTVATAFFNLPTEAVTGTLNVVDTEVQKLLDALPMAPAMARRECLMTCGLLDDDDSSDSSDDNDDSH